MPGTLEATLVARGYDCCSTTPDDGIPIEGTGALLVAWDDEQLARLPALEAKAAANGYTRAAEVVDDELYEREPHLGPGALGALRAGRAHHLPVDDAARIRDRGRPRRRRAAPCTRVTGRAGDGGPLADRSTQAR